VYAIDQDNEGTRVDVMPNGQLIMVGPRRRSWVPLDQIVFTTDTFKAVAEDLDHPISKEGNALQLKSGFSDFAQGFRNAIWTRVGPMCFVSGKVQAADIRSTIATLPEACRPTGIVSFDLHNGVYDAYPFTLRVDVFPNGDIKVVAEAQSVDSSSTGNYVSLDGISFAVAGTKNNPLSLGQLRQNYRPYRNGFEEPAVAVYDDVCIVTGMLTTVDKSFPPTGEMMVLPEDCRPVDGQLIFTANHNSFSWRVDVLTDGRVYAQTYNGRAFPTISVANLIFFRTTGTALTLLSGWGAYNSGYRRPTYKKVDNLCLLSGLMSGSRRGTFSVLPEECRPMERLQFTVNNHDYSARVDVFPDGRLDMPWQNRYGWLPLDGISFVVPKNRAASAYPVIKDAAAVTKALPLADGLEIYKRTYLPPEYSVFGKLCMLGGVARSPADLQRTLAQLPEECRPSGRISFDRHTKGDLTYRMDIFPSGEIAWGAGAYADDLLTFDGMVFPVAGAPQGNILLLNHWVANGKGYQDPGWLVQGELCVLTGTARTDSNRIAEYDGTLGILPPDCRPTDGRLIINVNHNEVTHRFDILTDGTFVLQATPNGILYPFIPLSGIAFMTKSASSPLTMASGWGSLGGDYRIPSYRVQGNLCILSGVANGNGASVLMQLPKECRPRGRLWFNVNHHVYVDRYDIGTDGTVEYISGTKYWSWVSLDGMSFIRQM